MLNKSVSYRNNIIGLINIRDFALLDTKSEKFTVRSLMTFYKHRYGNTVMADDSCYDVFNKLKKGKSNSIFTQMLSKIFS